MDANVVNPRAAELLAALPEDLRGPVSRDEELRTLLSALSSKPVPTGRLFRMWSLGSLQARLAAAYLAYWIRSGFAGADRRARLKREAHLSAAVKLLGSMSYLRGAIMKVGQILASYPEFVPDEFVETLAALHSEAPPMHYSLLREQVRSELGGDPETLFREFETDAFAAASLGQVHRARLHTGERVAVKIQYPGIARTIQADFANGRALMQPMRLLKDWDNFIENGAEIERILLLEADYENERANSEKARALLADLDDVVIPRTYAELSSRRVLTMDYLDGLHPREFMTTGPSAAVRNRHAAQILRVTSRLLFDGRLIAADPNPGNFLALPDGRLGLIDFGCFREATDEEWPLFLTAERAAQHGGADYVDLLRDGALMTEKELQDDGHVACVKRSCDWTFESFREDAPFDFSDPEYMKRGFDAMAELMRRRYTKSVAVFLWANRMNYGIAALAYTLHAEVNHHRIRVEELERVGRGPSAT